MTQHQAPEVTQRARDAAADFAWDEGDVGTAALRFNIRHGRCDQHPAVQAFARFEADTRATQPLSLTVDEGRLRDCLAVLLDEHDPSCGHFDITHTAEKIAPLLLGLIQSLSLPKDAANV